VIIFALFPSGSPAQEKEAEEEEDSPPRSDPLGIAMPPEEGEFQLQWIESVNEVLDKPLTADEGVPGELPKSTRAASVVSGKQFDRSLFPTVVEPLFEDAGVEYRREGPADLVPVIRGLSGRRVAILLDGYRMDDPADPPALFNPLSAADPFAVRHIEIIHGPSPAVNGGGAMGGVIDISERRRAYFDDATNAAGDFSGRFGSANGEASGNAYGEMNIRDFAGANASATSRNLGRTHFHRRIYNTAYHTDNASSSIDGYIGDRLMVSMLFHHLAQSDVPVFDDGDGETDSIRQWDFGTFSVTAKRMSRVLRFARVTGGYGEKLWRRDDADRDSESDEVRVRRLSGDAVFEMPAGRYVTFVYGAEYSESLARSDSSIGRYAPMPDGSRYRIAAFHFAPRLEPFRRVKLLPSFRVENASVSADLDERELRLMGLQPPEGKIRYGKTVYGGGISGRVQISTHNSLFGGYVQNHRFPDLTDIAGYFPSGGGVRHALNDEIEPEIIRTGDFGFRMHFPFVKGQVSIHHSDLRDLIEVRERTFPDNRALIPSRLIRSENADPAFINGVEGEVDSYLGINWNWGLTLAYQEGKKDDGAPFDGVPPFFGGTHVRWTNDTGDIALDVAGRFAGAQSDLGEADASLEGVRHGEVPGYAALDLRVAVYQARYAEIRLGALNVTGSRIYHVGSRIPETGPNFVGQLVFHLF
jgi:outer membrane receptor protein involved in Fe transport